MTDPVSACATTPPFVTVQGLIQRHALTSADRRKTVAYVRSELSLTDDDLDHHDIDAFYEALLQVYQQGPRAYRDFVSALAATGGKAGQRALHEQCFSHVYRRLKPDERSKLREDLSGTIENEFFRKFFTNATEDQEVENVAWLLWSDWLVCGRWNFAKTIIEANPHLAARFGGWQPTDCNEALPITNGVAMRYDGTEAEVSECNPADDQFEGCFVDLISRLERARQTCSPTSLREISTLAAELADKIEEYAEGALEKLVTRAKAVVSACAASSYPPLAKASARLQQQFEANGRFDAATLRDAIETSEIQWREVGKAETGFRSAKAASDAEVWDDKLKSEADQQRYHWMDRMTALAQTLDSISERLERAHIGNGTAISTDETEVDAGKASDVAKHENLDETDACERGAKQAISSDGHPPSRDDGVEPLATVSFVVQASETEPSTPPENVDTASDPTPVENYDVERAAALSLAVQFLHRDEIGLFQLACEAGEILHYGTPPAETASLVGCMAREDYLGLQRYRAGLARWTALKELPASVEHGSVLLVFASLILPAITTAVSGARDVLRQLDLGEVPDACHKLRIQILDLGPDYPALTAMRMPVDDEAARRSLQKAREDYDQYLQTARQRTLAYQPATVVWEALLRDPVINGISGSGPLQPVALKAKVERALDLLGAPDALIDRIDEERRGRNAKRKRIIARARQSLLNNVSELVDHLSALRRCLDFTEHGIGVPGRRPDERPRGKIFSMLCHTAAAALRQEAEDANSDDAFAISCHVIASRLIEAQAEALEKGQFENPFADAFRFDRYRLPPSARQRTNEEPDVVWHALQLAACEPHRSWLEVFERAIEQDDHLASGAVLALAQSLASGRHLDVERKEAIDHARSELVKCCGEVHQDLIRAMNYAPFNDTELDALRVEIEALIPDELPLESVSVDGGEGVVPSANMIADFPAAYERLAEAKRSIAKVEHDAISEARDRILQLKASRPPQIIDYLNDLVQRADLITLMEELPLVERGQQIALDAPGATPLEDFAAALRDVDGSGAEASRRLRELISGVEKTASRAMNLARAWEQLMEVRRGNPSQHIRNLLTEIGFVVVGEVEEIDQPTRFLRSFRLRTRRIAVRETCAVARFGSEASGRYYLVVADKDARPAEIIEAIPASGATLLLVKNALGIQERLELARLARQKDRAFCLVDTELVLFLAGRANPLADFFACGIPFGAASPFALQPGSIPVEVFFGRTQEIRSVYESDGSCIVYGGRQLGKSVMLDHIAKTLDVSGRVLVRRIDCQSILNQSIDVWRIIANSLNDAGLTQLTSPRTPEQIVRTIRSWLDEKSERRILLMLDETNEFVIRDAENGFPELIRLRGLMEDTGRRFKVVLSGQHNVLRLTHNPNTPLAHFGQPIAIGPLRGADLRAARQLVTEPLAAVGYKFSDQGLVSRILAETQYYPKLIQILCQNLLRHMRRTVSDGRHKDLPPWVIRREDINAILHNNDILREIFHTFQITLQLDKRYELISLIFADKLYDRKSDHDSRVGFSVQELMDEAFRFWRNGFPTSNKREVFHALLDELVGLGILIEDVSSGRYQLGSPIIGSMIGTAEEVEHRLLAFEAEALPPEIEPERRRMPVNSEEPWPILSPLVPAQIDTILARPVAKGSVGGSKIAVVFGTGAMGIDRVAESLQTTTTPSGAAAAIRKLRVHVDRVTFIREVGSIRQDPHACFVVPADTPWEPDWVREAAEIRGKTRFVFLGDASHAWRWCRIEDLAFRKGVLTETLAPLSAEEIEDQLRRNATHISEPRVVAKQLYNVTGGFLAPFASAVKDIKSDRDANHALQRFAANELNPGDYGVPIIPIARRAVGVLLDYILPNGDDRISSLDLDIRVSDLEIMETETGVDGRLLANWLVAVGLAEPSMLNSQVEGDREGVRLNPILRHPSVRRACGMNC